MTVAAEVLVASKFIENVETVQFVANTVTIIDAITVTNTSGSAVTLNVAIVNNSGSPSDENRFVKSRTLRSKESYLCPDLIGHVLGVGEAVFAQASSSNGLIIRASGRVFSA